MKRYITLLSAILITTLAFGQSIGINTNSPDSSAVFDVQSTSKGMLVPRMKKFQRLTIPNPAEGLLVFDTDSDAFWYYQDGWKKISDNNKNIWLREGSFSPAEVGDTAMYFVGNVSIGKDTSGAKLVIHSEENIGLKIIEESKDAVVPVGLNIIMEDSSANQQQGISTLLNGSAVSRIGHIIRSYSNDSLTDWVYGNWVDLSNSSQIEDSIERILVGSLNKIRGYENTVQVGTRNLIEGSAFGRQRGTLNEMDGRGDGEQIGTYSSFSFSSGKGAHIGTKNVVTGSGIIFGTLQEFSSSSDSTIYGMYNDMDIPLHDGEKYGVYNFLKSSSNDSAQYAINNQIQGSSNDGNHFGLSNTMNSSGSGDRFGVENVLTGNSSGKQYGISNLIDNTGSNTHYGVLNSLEGTSTGQQYGSFQSITNSGSGSHTGTQNTMGGTGTGIKYGTQNSMSATGNGTHYGTKNTMVGGGGGTHYGSHTSMGASGIGDKYADWNSITNSKNGTHYGEYTSLSGSGSGTHYGSNIKLSGTGTGPQYGHLVEVTNSGDAAHFGNRATLEGSGNGFQYGNSNVITNTGSAAHYGTQNTLIGPGTGSQFGTYNSVAVSGNGAHYGTFNQTSGSGTGIHVAGYFNSPGTGSNKYAAVFNAGNVVANEIGGDNDFRVESDNHQHMLFVDGGVNRIGIKTNTPEKELDVRGSAIVERNSGSTTPQLTLKENGLDYSRLTFVNDQVDTTYWTIAARANNDDASSRFNVYYNQSGNVMSLQGDGDAVFQKRLLVGTGTPDAVLHAKSTSASSNLLKLENGSQEVFNVNTSGVVSIGGTPSGNIPYTVYIPTKLSLGVANPFYRFSLPNNNMEGIGLAIAKNWLDYSDARVKKNVVNSKYGLKEVLALRPVQYDHHSSTFEDDGLSVKEDYTKAVGFIAQEVHEIVEEIVKKPVDENKQLWSMDYAKLTPVLVKAIQELALENERLKAQNGSQQTLINQLNERQTKVEELLSVLMSQSNQP